MTKSNPANGKVRFRIDFGDACSLGPGKIDLLEGIGATGSLSQAGRALGMSYRRAWMLLDSLNSSFDEPVVTTTTGGKAGGGTQLTSLGRTIVQVYRELERDFDAQAAKQTRAIASAVRVGKRVSLRTPLVRSQAPRRVPAARQSNVRAR